MQMWVGMSSQTDPVLRQPSAEDEIDGAFNVAVLEVVATFVVIQSILSSHKPTPVECSHVSRNSNGSCLPAHGAIGRSCCGILPIPVKSVSRLMKYMNL